MLLGQVRHLVDRVEVARVHLAGVGDDDRGVALQLGEAALQRVEVEAARRVPGQLAHVGGADPEHRQRLGRARVDVPAREDRDLRGARQSRARDALPTSLPAPVAGDRQAGEVGHRASGHQDAAELGRQLEQVAQPIDADALEAAGERRGHPGAGVLVEGRGQPVGGEGRGRRAADHEVKEAGAGRSGRRLVAESSQVADRRERSSAVLGQSAAELRDRLLAAARLHRVAIQLGEEGASLRGGEVQRPLELRAPFPGVSHRPAC